MSLTRFLRPSHQHSAFSATVLLMTAVMLSRVIGFIRESYIAYQFGAGGQVDAYVAAFTLPDWLNYIVAGGTASITFVSIYTRFLAEKREADAQKTFSIIITVMTTVLVAGVIVAEIFAPQISGWMFHGFTAHQLDLTVRLTRILLPAQIFFYVGGVVSAVLSVSPRSLMAPSSEASSDHSSSTPSVRAASVPDIVHPSKSRIPHSANGCDFLSRLCSASHSSPPTIGFSATSRLPASATSHASTTQSVFSLYLSPFSARPPD